MTSCEENHVFQIGDRVICTYPDNDEMDTPYSLKGHVGTIRAFYPKTYHEKFVVGVEYDEQHSGLLHSLDGNLQTRNGWWHFTQELMPVKECSEVDVGDLL